MFCYIAAQIDKHKMIYWDVGRAEETEKDVETARK